MKRALPIAGILLVACIVTFSQRRAGSDFQSSNLPLAQTDKERSIVSVLDKMVRSRETYLSVPVQDGKALRLLTEVSRAKNVVEIGTSTGYSGLWFCLGLGSTGGHLTTFEIDSQRASMARRHFKEAGVDDIVTLVEGDAHKEVLKLSGPIDLAFIDADKEGYVDYLNKLLPLVRPGGLILAHNVDMVRDYDKAVTSNPDLETIFYREGNGLSISLKKR
jgi:caffeoyl-CoA O-methyltransferase